MNKKLGALALAAGMAAALPAGATVVADWNNAALQELRLAKLGPPMAARALAVTHTCIYDAWTAYDAKAWPVAWGAPRQSSWAFTDANKHKAISYAAYRCLVNLFPAGAARLQAQMTSLGYDPADTSLNIFTPQGVGNAAANAVIAQRRGDSSNQYGDMLWNGGPYADWSGYASANAPLPFCLPKSAGNCTPNAANNKRWQPLINDKGVTQAFIGAHWQYVAPFALTWYGQFDDRPEVAAGPNYAQSPARYAADVDQMIQISGALTDQQKLIVEYWADGPASELPPGHWGLLAQHVSRSRGQTIDQDAKMFFALHSASHDAGIVAWHLKRKHDGVRPITAVRETKEGQIIFAWGGPGQPSHPIPGQKWTPYNPGSNLSPAFPGWVSGHSTFSAASAAVLRAFTGSDVLNFSTTLPANFGRVEPNVPPVPTTLSYPTITSAVVDAGLSRLYAGIHFADDNAVGLMVGHRVGQQAWKKAQTLFNGGVAPADEPQEWGWPVAATQCANEGGTCVIPAGYTATLWYGWGANWAVRSGVVGTAYCKNEVYGDPRPGTVKQCWMRIDGPAPALPASAVDCAAEGGSCSLPAGTVATVWFGVNGVWSPRSGLVGRVDCHSHTFATNPVVGVAERCAYTAEKAYYPLPPLQNAVACGGEGSGCTIPYGRKATVWYGVDKQWTTRDGVWSVAPCTNKFFGDPAPGRLKSCAYVLEP